MMVSVRVRGFDGETDCEGSYVGECVPVRVEGSVGDESKLLV